MSVQMTPVFNRGVGGFGNSIMDPFNMSGWNNQAPVDTTGAQPGYPSYLHGYDPSSMSLFNMEQGGINGIDTATGKSAADAFTQQAMRTGPSAWANLATNKSDQDTRASQSQASAYGAGQTAQAQSGLAANGGLDSGARERIARSGSKATMDQQQKLAGQNIQNKMQIGMNDEQNRISQLAQAPSVQNTANQGQFQQQGMLDSARGADVGHQLQETQNQNLFNMNQYDAQMAAWAASKQSDATINSGKSHGGGK